MLLLFFLGCTAGETSADRDGDGWTDRDCAPDDASANPDAPDDDCDGVDDDCDGQVDEHAEGARLWYLDADGDGYGAFTDPVTGCAAPEGYAERFDDCDDGDPTAYPDAPETDDGVDNDCDGYVDERGADHTLADAWATLLAEDPDDDVGDPLTSGRDVDGDGRDDLLVGGGYLFTAVPAGTGSLGDATTRWRDGDGSLAGWTVAWAGDVDGDGVEDVALSAEVAGDACVVSGGDRGDASLAEAIACMDAAEEDMAGVALAGVGDTDGDGLAEVAVGMPGASAVVLLGDDGFRFERSGAGTELVSPGDLDGDGLADLWISARDDGAVHLVLSPLTGSPEPDATFTAEAGSSLLYDALASPGDLDGDGLVDLAVGAVRAGAGNDVYVVTDALAGGSLAGAAATLTEEEACTYFEGVTLGGGDLDGDGRGDLVVGLPSCSFEWTLSGAVYVFAGPIDGTFAMREAEVVVSGETPNDALGNAVGVAPDLDGDGAPELVASTRPPYNDDTNALYLWTTAGWF